MPFLKGLLQFSLRDFFSSLNHPEHLLWVSQNCGHVSHEHCGTKPNAGNGERVDKTRKTPLHRVTPPSFLKRPFNLPLISQSANKMLFKIFRSTLLLWSNNFIFYFHN